MRRLLAPCHLERCEYLVYPPEIAPHWLRPFYGLYRATLSRWLPTGYLFVGRKLGPKPAGRALKDR